uniref:Uncharacterized protein n=1 Tax=Trichogramma kaykai TaxID=54128 RepID=A0ABD2WX53_9HYME
MRFVGLICLLFVAMVCYSFVPASAQPNIIDRMAVQLLHVRARIRYITCTQSLGFFARSARDNDDGDGDDDEILRQLCYMDATIIFVYKLCICIVHTNILNDILKTMEQWSSIFSVFCNFCWIIFITLVQVGYYVTI